MSIFYLALTKIEIFRRICIQQILDIVKLKYIKLAGFKSFVDPISISMPGNLVGVVGPNGCGKSNVIDAIRWVMGESSAKTLRGDQMADVIFNGSSARKPVGKASVELIFDNSEGKAPGPYAKYNEISIRRELSRDGQSNYFINKTKTRRRDITDIFLGTGLGPRSYSIIEQGMVGRIIEARPEELRTLIEEAAGISKYKERRRETENRIRHTRENLSRVEDIRKELNVQLNRLQRQSAAAERYKKLKDQEKNLKAQLMSLRWQSLVKEVGDSDTELARVQKQTDGKLSEQRAVESNIESLRIQQNESNEAFNKTQGEYYRTGADISSIEQNIRHLRETREQQKQELQHLSRAQQEANEHLEKDRARLQELEQLLASTEPDIQFVSSVFDQAQENFGTADKSMAQWQSEWEAFGVDSAVSDQERRVQSIKIEEYQKQINTLADRQGRHQQLLQAVDDQLSKIDIEELRESSVKADQTCDELRDQIDNLNQSLQDRRSVLEEHNDSTQDLREQLRKHEARLESFKEIQSAASDEDKQTWLKEQNLEQAPRLASELEVKPGWELAVDRVLDRRASAICVDDLQGMDLGPAADVVLIQKSKSSKNNLTGEFPKLIEKVKVSNVDLNSWLNGVYAADNLAQAYQWREKIRSEESIITREGIWFGVNWIDLGAHDSHGAVVRGLEIESLEKKIEQTNAQLEQYKQTRNEHVSFLTQLEEDLSHAQRELAERETNRYKLSSELARMEARLTELEARREQLSLELIDITSQLAGFRDQTDKANKLLSNAKQQSVGYASRREDLLSQRDQLRQHLDEARVALDKAREHKHEIAFARQREQTESDNLKENIARLRGQQTHMSQRQTELEGLLGDDEQPEKDQKQTLESLLTARVNLEQQLAEARANTEKIDEEIRTQEKNRHDHQMAVQAKRDQLEKLRILRQEVIVRRDTLRDQILELGKDPQSITDSLPNEAREDSWEEELNKVIKRIERIGPVNLVAIEEFEEQSERKQYLDKQSEDLNSALATLESVIQKIDKETRTRFKGTFEKLNTRFQEFFPRLFGGGSAYLELTGSDLLDTGVTVMARPPGKRNSTIHLLSGGEKALTAVSLLFSFFDLNPAPFCVLDEVDAPLDDANVQRYSETLKTLANRTQLIFITHNKITMESADILIGVTMGEPGVSRLVSVDVAEAVEMVAQ